MYAEVGPDIQGLTTVQNRTQQSNETVVYYKLLELLLFL